MKGKSFEIDLRVVTLVCYEFLTIKNKKDLAMAKNSLAWNRSETDEKLNDLLSTLAEEYAIFDNGTGKNLKFIPTNNPDILKVSQKSTNVVIEYGSIVAAARGIGHALAGKNIDEDCVFSTLGIMLDCSRNAVMTVPYLKKWLRRLALMGYNMVMLYTEDTYQLPDEPYFGYMRGGYTLEEMQEVDAYAAKLGIEMVACIQTLGHLEHIIRWGQAYSDVTDTDRVLLVDEEKTYTLINKMLTFWGKAFRSRRIHVGMDETHDLGRGRFMDKFGYERGFDIFNRHLTRVTEICQNIGLKPIIWSDMYFRMGNPNQDYYDPKTVIPEDVKAMIPSDVTLCYWDYYHRDEAFYTDWIRRHRDLGHEPQMGSGVWTWACMWYDHEQTVATVTPCLNACRKEKVKEVYFTMWGDFGAFCEYDSSLAGLAWAADLAYGGKGTDSEVAPLFEAVCGGSYQDQLTAAEIMVNLKSKSDRPTRFLTHLIVWDDPMLGIVWNEFKHYDTNVWSIINDKMAEVYQTLAPSAGNTDAGDIDYVRSICDFIIKKIAFRTKLLQAYQAKNKTALSEVITKNVPECIDALEILTALFRRQWLRRNKPFGLEIMQIRFAGQAARLQETAQRIQELLDGTTNSIPEIEAIEANPNPVGQIDQRYARNISGSML